MNPIIIYFIHSKNKNNIKTNLELNIKYVKTT